MPVKDLDLESLIIDTVGTVVVVTDDVGRIVRFNAAGTRIFGYPEPEIRGQLLWEVFTLPENRDAARKRFVKLMSGELFEFQTNWKTRGGGVRHMSFFCRGIVGQSGQIQYTIGTGIDITDRLMAEAALRDSEERFRTMVENAAIGIGLIDEHGTYLQVNPAFCRMVGYERGELLKMSIRSITHPDDQEQNVRLVRKLVAGELSSYILEKRYLTRSGECIWVQVSASLASLKPGGGKVVIGLFQNISERKHAEESQLRLYADQQAQNETLERRVTERTAELVARTEQLAQSEKALRKSNAKLEQANAWLRQSEQHFRQLADSHLNLAREVSHRVRNNLGGLLALTGVMRKRTSDVGSFADAIDARIEAMRHVHSMLAESCWTPIELRKLVDNTLATLQHSAPHPAAIVVQGPEIFIPMRRVQPLTLVLVEWFTNSCKYGSHSIPGGQVTIAWTLSDDNGLPRLRLQWTESGGPPVKPPIKTSLGTDLVQGFIRCELAGRCTLRYPPQGADHVLEFTVRPDVEIATLHSRTVGA